MLKFLQLHLEIEKYQQKKSIAELSDDQLRREQELELLRFWVDAANDPKRRQTLEQLLQLHGLKLVGTNPSEIFNDPDTTIDSTTIAGSGTGTEAPAA